MNRPRVILLGVALALSVSCRAGAQSEAQSNPSGVAQQNLSRECSVRMEELRLGTPGGGLPGSLRGITCRDLGYDAADRPPAQTARTGQSVVQRTLRECLTAVSALASQLDFVPFKSQVDGRPCPGQQAAVVRSTLVFVQGPTVNDFTITLVDAQGVTYQAGPDSRFPVLSSEDWRAQQKQLALRDGARAIYYACLVKLEEMGRSIPPRFDGATCADLGVNTFGTSSRIQLFPWTTEKYQLTFTNLEGQTRHYPDKTMPTREQAQFRAAVKAVFQTLLSALMLLFLLWLMTLIPGGRFLAWPGVGLGVLGVLSFVPALRYQAIDLADGLVQIALIVLTALALSLFLPRRVWWPDREPVWVSFGFSFMLALLFLTPGGMAFIQLANVATWQTGLFALPLASLMLTLLLLWRRQKKDCK